jgi:hypothetical protein
MPTEVVESKTAGEVVFTTPLNRIGVIKVLEIDNKTASDITITIQDVFTPSETQNNPNPSEVTENRLVVTVKAGEHKSLDLHDGIEILGTCKVTGTLDATDCKITISYAFKY